VTRIKSAPMLLCIGKNGQLASAIARVSKSYDIVVHFAGREYVDLFDERELAALIGDLRPDAIINTAAYTHVDDAESHAESAYKLNQVAAGLIAVAAQKQGVRLIHVSTDYVFSGTKSEAYRPDDATDPQSVYGLSKCAGEVAVLAGYPQALVVRTSWLYGPDAPNFMATMLRLAKNQKTIRVVDDQVGSPTYVDDLASGLLDLALAQGPGGIYHLTSQGDASWAQFAAYILSKAGELGEPSATIEPITTREYPTPAKRPQNSCLDGSHIEAIYGIKLAHWQDGVTRCLEQLRRTSWGTS
jgi:dTDP-4-dehydrorhamnose reductase